MNTKPTGESHTQNLTAVAEESKQTDTVSVQTAQVSDVTGELFGLRVESVDNSNTEKNLLGEAAGGEPEAKGRRGKIKDKTFSRAAFQSLMAKSALPQLGLILKEVDIDSTEITPQMQEAYNDVLNLAAIKKLCDPLWCECIEELIEAKKSLTASSLTEREKSDLIVEIEKELIKQHWECLIAQMGDKFVDQTPNKEDRNPLRSPDYIKMIKTRVLSKRFCYAQATGGQSFLLTACRKKTDAMQRQESDTTPKKIWSPFKKQGGSPPEIINIIDPKGYFDQRMLIRFDREKMEAMEAGMPEAQAAKELEVKIKKAYAVFGQEDNQKFFKTLKRAYPALVGAVCQFYVTKIVEQKSKQRRLTSADGKLCLTAKNIKTEFIRCLDSEEGQVELFKAERRQELSSALNQVMKEIRQERDFFDCISTPMMANTTKACKRIDHQMQEESSADAEQHSLLNELKLLLEKLEAKIQDAVLIYIEEAFQAESCEPAVFQALEKLTDYGVAVDVKLQELADLKQGLNADLMKLQITDPEQNEDYAESQVDQVEQLEKEIEDKREELSLAKAQFIEGQGKPAPILGKAWQHWKLIKEQKTQLIMLVNEAQRILADAEKLLKKPESSGRKRFSFTKKSAN